MIENDLFIKTEEEFARAQKVVDAVFDTKKDLPEQVFRGGFTNFRFEEFDWGTANILGDKNIVDIFREISAITKDDFVVMAMRDLVRTREFYKEFGCYNWLKLPVDIVWKDYYEVLMLELDDESTLVFNSHIFHWTGSSRQWGMWADWNFELCVFGLSEEADAESILPILSDWGLIDFVTSNSSDWSVVEYLDTTQPYFKSEMAKNYSK